MTTFATLELYVVLDFAASRNAVVQNENFCYNLSRYADTILLVVESIRNEIKIKIYLRLLGLPFRRVRRDYSCKRKNIF